MKGYTMSKEPKVVKVNTADDLQEFVTEHGLSLGDIPRDPETGQILYDQLTDEQREDLQRLNESAKRMTAALEKGVKTREHYTEAKERYTKAKEKYTQYAEAKEQYTEKREQAAEARARGIEYRKSVEKMTAAADAAIQKTLRKNGDAFEALAAALNPFFNEKSGDTLRRILEQIKPTIDLLDELLDNAEQIEEELKKDCYSGKTLGDYLNEYTASEMLEMSSDENSDLYKALQATRRKRETIAAQNAGREKRRKTKTAAEQTNAIMKIEGGIFALFSSVELQDAFSNGHIMKMGTLDTNYIDKQTGRVQKYNFEEGETLPLKANDIPYNALMLLTTILKNSVSNTFEEFVKSGNITFYVKGALDSISVDARSFLPATDGQLNFDRKTAGAVYLESLFEPLQGYIGMTPGGDRYSVFSYEGYDAESDTMTIRTPYIYQLWRKTQGDYFNRQATIAEHKKSNKRPPRAALTPQETNRFFKRKFFTANPVTQEIAVYITDKLLQAGNAKTKEKHEEEE